MKIPPIYSTYKAWWMTAALIVWLAITLGFDVAPSALRWPLRLLWLLVTVLPMTELLASLRKLRLDRKKLVFAVILIVFCGLMLEGICWVFIRVMSQRDDRLARRGALTLAEDMRHDIQTIIDDKSRPIFSSTIGWLPRPGFKDQIYTINAQGLHADHEYAVPPADPAKRILCIGDSFTFGVAVHDDQSYPHYAEAQLPGTEWLNFGNPGCCLTQSYLRYHEEAKKYGGKHVVIGFMTNDAQRTVNCFRPFLNSDTYFPMTKPFAKFADGKLTLEPNPFLSREAYKELLDHPLTELQRLRSLDYLTWSQQTMISDPIVRTITYVMDSLHLDRKLEAIVNGTIPFRSLLRRMLPDDCYGSAIWRPESPGFQAICALFDRYYEEVEKDGCIPLIVIMPGPLDVANHVEGQPRVYAGLIEHFKARQYRHLDFLDPLVTKHKANLAEDALFVRLHYQPPINKELADEIIRALGLQ